MFHPQLQQHLQGFSDETANTSQQQDEDIREDQAIALQSAAPLPIDSCQTQEEPPSDVARGPKSHAAGGIHGGRPEILLVQVAILWIPVILQHFDVASTRPHIGWWMLLSLVLVVLMTPRLGPYAFVWDAKLLSILRPHTEALALSVAEEPFKKSAEKKRIAFLEDLRTNVAARLVWMAAPPLCWVQKDNEESVMASARMSTTSVTTATTTITSLDDGNTHSFCKMANLFVAWMDAHVRWMQTVDEVLATLGTATALHLGRTHDTGDATVRRLERAALGRHVRHLERTDKSPQLRRWPWMRYRRHLYTLLQAQLHHMEECLRLVVSCGSHNEITAREESKDEVVTLSRLRNARFLLADRMSEVVGHLMERPIIMHCPSRLTQWLQQDMVRVDQATAYYTTFEHWKEQQNKFTSGPNADPAWTGHVSSLLECAETLRTAVHTMTEQSHPAESEAGWLACRLAYEYLTVQLESVQAAYFDPVAAADRETADKNNRESLDDRQRPQGLVEREEYSIVTSSVDAVHILRPKESVPTTSSTLVFAGQGTRARPSTKCKAKKYEATTTRLPPVMSEQSLLAELRRHLATLPSPPEILQEVHVDGGEEGKEDKDTCGEQGSTDDGLRQPGAENTKQCGDSTVANMVGGLVLSELSAAIQSHSLKGDETFLE